MKPIWVRKGNVRSKTGIWGATDEDVKAVRAVMANGPVECASDGSVMGKKSAVAVWFGNRDVEDGVMTSREVRGYPHDSGRAELDGPILALEVLKRIEEVYGETCEVKLWTDSAEVVGVSKRDKLKLLPSRSCVRNADMLLHKRHLVETYGGKVDARKVKAHQDKDVKYADLSYEARMNVDCDGAAKEEAMRAEGSDYVDEMPEGVKALMWSSWGV